MSEFSFKSLWENAGRWLVPGGLVVDFMVKKMIEIDEKAQIEKTLQDIAKTTDSAFALPTEPKESSSSGPVSKAFLVELSQAHEISTARIDQLDTQYSALKDLQNTFLNYDSTLPPQAAHRLEQLETLFKDGTPSLEQSLIFHADLIEKSGDKAGVLNLALYEGQAPGPVIFNVEQAQQLAAQIDARSAQLSTERGEAIPPPVTLETAVTMLARMNDLASQSQQAVGIEITIDREGIFLLNARTAEELSKSLEAQAAPSMPVAQDEKKAPVSEPEPMAR